MKFLLLIIPAIFLFCTGNVKDTNSNLAIDTVCIQHHVYYETLGTYQGGIAPKLSDDGRPCHCD